MLTTLDILYIVLSLCVFLITVGIVWTLISVLVILKRFRQVQKTAVEKINALWQLFDGMREKIEHSTSHIVALVEIASKAFEYLRSKKRAKKNKSSNGS